MDQRARGFRPDSSSGRRLSVFSLSLFLLILSACGEADRAESVLPAKTETCGGSAITSRYIVHYHSGKWDVVDNPSRDEFREGYVRPRLEEIEFIEYDQLIRPHTDAPIVSPSSGIDNWGVAAIEAPKAWEKNIRGEGAIVAVIDSGMDVTHSQLVSQIAYNEGESGTKRHNGLDDDGNGLVDDYAGYSFFDNTGDVTDESGHGTHVSGVIAAQHNDTAVRTGYVQGLAPKAKILPIKFLSSDGGSLSAALKGIDYAIARGARVINASWGGEGCSQSLRKKVSEAISQNVLFVAAAGNSGVNLERTPEYPAAFSLPLQITVGAIRSSLNMDSYSNYSRSLVHIFAPGTMVVSTVPDGYAGMSGTSMAAPFVAGAAALLVGANPEAGAEQIRNFILENVETDADYMNSTSGRLNIGKIINALGR